MYLSIVAVIDSHTEQENHYRQDVYADIRKLETEDPEEMLGEIVKRVEGFLSAGSMQPPNRVISVSHSVFSIS